jgi:hypothetical protein
MNDARITVVGRFHPQELNNLIDRTRYCVVDHSYQVVKRTSKRDGSPVVKIAGGKTKSPTYLISFH